MSGVPFSRPSHTHVSPEDAEYLPPPDEREDIPVDIVFPVDVAESYPLSGRVVWLILATTGTWLTRREIANATGMAESSVLTATNDLCEGGYVEWRYDTWNPTRYLFRTADPSCHADGGHKPKPLDD